MRPTPLPTPPNRKFQRKTGSGRSHKQGFASGKRLNSAGATLFDFPLFYVIFIFILFSRLPAMYRNCRQIREAVADAGVQDEPLFMNSYHYLVGSWLFANQSERNKEEKEKRRRIQLSPET